MKLSKLVGERTKEAPSGATCKSQALLARAGYIKQVSNGIYTMLMPAQKVSQKIQQIIREEMDAIGGQEVLFPVVMPREMWDESGRYTSIGSEMVRFKDRTGHDMLLGMTHEEAAVHAVKNIVRSYTQLPLMIYQIQTKFRDEARSRAGLIRVREFTMKDAYSFHDTQESLEKYYKEVYEAYFKIYKRIGLKNVISVASDSGMMGGKVAHEYMLLTDIGEDSLALCDACDYKANVEVAKGIMQPTGIASQPLKMVDTGNAKTIEEVCALLKIKPENTCKAVAFAIEGEFKKTLLVFVRGDREVSEAKIKAIIGKGIAPSELKDGALVAGNIGPINLNSENLIVMLDSSLKDEHNLVCGANKANMHYVGLDIQRDLGAVNFVEVSKAGDGDICPICGKGHLHISRGVEIGNIFQLGTKYTEPMNMTVLNANGEQINPIMGCYGIGVGRNLACIAEESVDEKGLVWNMNVAPWHIEICPLKQEEAGVMEASESLYKALKKNGLDVLFDDRKASPGVKFADSELLGIPVRAVISPRSLENNSVEIAFRETGEKQMIDLNNVVKFLTEYVNSKKF